MKSQSSQGQKQQQAKTFNFVQFAVVNTKGLAIETSNKIDESHTIIGISYIAVRSIGECCCNRCPNPNNYETVSYFEFNIKIVKN